MSDASARLALPLLQAGQAQKEVAHNEALAAIDLLLQAAVEAVAATPPASPAVGQCWIVGAGAGGAWGGRAGCLAGWSEAGWRFATPAEGMAAWIKGAGVPARFAGGAWSIGTIAGDRVTIGGVQVVGARQPAIMPPSGGATVDTEARAAIGAVIVALKAHGLIDP